MFLHSWQANMQALQNPIGDLTEHVYPEKPQTSIGLSQT